MPHCRQHCPGRVGAYWRGAWPRGLRGGGGKATLLLRASAEDRYRLGLDTRARGRRDALPAVQCREPDGHVTRWAGTACRDQAHRDASLSETGVRARGCRESLPRGNQPLCSLHASRAVQQRLKRECCSPVQWMCQPQPCVQGKPSLQHASYGQAADLPLPAVHAVQGRPTETLISSFVAFTTHEVVLSS